MTKPEVSIKGIRDGLLISIGGNGAWLEAEAAILKSIQTKNEFFRGAQIALEVGERALDRKEIRRLSDKLAEHDVRLWALLGKSPETLRAARRIGLETDLPERDTKDIDSPEESAGESELPPIDANEYGSSGVLVKNTVRSGRIIRHVGHVVVIGDVNPGAQIIAGGDVLIWGKLRGTVHAGANGDETAVVCALDMRPTQLRIANHVAISPNIREPRPNPEIAFVSDDQIVAEELG